MLIVNARIITMERENKIIGGGAILVRDGKIVEIGDSNEMRARFPNEETMNAKGKIVMPANICAHTHFYGAYSRGLSIPGEPPEDFPQILEKLWWGLDKSLSLTDVYHSAMLCLINAIRCGTTTLLDHHASPNAVDGSLDRIANAVIESGLRASLCYEVSDRDGENIARAGIRENVRFINSLRGTTDAYPHLSAMFGLHASLTLSNHTLKECRKAVPEGTGFHIHVAEHPVDESDSLEKSRTWVVNRLMNHGILGERSIAVHAVHVDDQEINLLAESGTWVTHQPRSNMNNAVGLPRVEVMMSNGIQVCLGNDGFSNAMWQEWKAAYLGHKLLNEDPRRMPGDLVMQMAVYNNANLVEMAFNGLRTGKLLTGYAADIIFVDYHPFTPLTTGNLPWHILFGFDESMITTTICGGKVLMDNHCLVGIDEGKIAAEAMANAPAVWERYKTFVVDNGSGNE